MLRNKKSVLENYISESLCQKWISIDHNEILNIAKQYSAIPEDVPKIETLHQNVAHMTLALKELETRALRVVNKTYRLQISDTDEFILPLVTCIDIIKAMIKETENCLDRYYHKEH